MKKFRFLITSIAFCWLGTGNLLYAQWETMMTDVITSGIYISPDYSRDKTLFLLDNNRILWRSSNEGFSWNKVLIAQDQSVPELMRMVISPEFLTDGTAYVIMTDGEVLKSTDSGLTWAPMPDMPANVTDLACSRVTAKGKYLYALTGAGGPENLFVSENEGVSWLLLQNLSATSVGYPRLWISGETASGSYLALQYEKDIFMSENGGTNLYHSFDQGFEGSLSDVVFSPAFSTDSTIFASDWKYVWKNNHAGNPAGWIKSELNSENMPVKLAISPTYLTDNTIYATTSGKVIKRSFDGGNSWENFGSQLNMNTSQIAITGEPPYVIFLGIVSDDQTSGKLLRSELIYGIDETQTIQRAGFFPNPASGESTLFFKTEKRASISLTIFDALGKVMVSRNLGEYDAGIQSVSLPLKGNLSVGGLYFCRLQAGDEYHTVKLAVK